MTIKVQGCLYGPSGRKDGQPRTCPASGGALPSRAARPYARRHNGGTLEGDSRHHAQADNVFDYANRVKLTRLRRAVSAASSLNRSRGAPRSLPSPPAKRSSTSRPPAPPSPNTPTPDTGTSPTTSGTPTTKAPQPTRGCGAFNHPHIGRANAAFIGHLQCRATPAPGPHARVPPSAAPGMPPDVTTWTTSCSPATPDNSHAPAAPLRQETPRAPWAYLGWDPRQAVTPGIRRLPGAADGRGPCRCVIVASRGGGPPVPVGEAGSVPRLLGKRRVSRRRLYPAPGGRPDSLAAGSR